MKAIQMTPNRVSAFLVTEIALLVSLASSDTDVSCKAGQGLRMLSYAERQPGAPLPPNISEEELTKRYPIYEQLGDPKVVIVGVYLMLPTPL
jgi:hypothetical protein